MKTLLRSVSVVALSAIAMTLTSNSQAQDAKTDDQPTSVTRQYPTTEPPIGSHQVLDRPYGTIVALALEEAPYPDDTRTTGFTRRNGEVIPYTDHYDDPTVAVVIPPILMGVRAGQPLDAIVHFHGHGNSPVNAIDKHLLGVQLKASNRPVLLIVPQGPKNARDSGIGKLEKQGGLAALLSGVERGLNKTGPLVGRKMRIGNVAISGHSGGYYPVSYCLEKGGLGAGRIREVWLFDAAYGRIEQIADGVTGMPNGRRVLRSIFTEHLADENLLLMARLGRTGRPLLVWNDREDSITSPTATVPGGPLGWTKHPLDQTLARTEVVFMSTALDHTGLIYVREYFRRFLEASSLGRGTVR